MVQQKQLFMVLVAGAAHHKQERKVIAPALGRAAMALHHLFRVFQ
jgi:hypothetical protein